MKKQKPIQNKKPQNTWKEMRIITGNIVSTTT